MYFIEFFQESATQPGTFVEACGDRSVIVVDGRESAWAHHSHARIEGKKRGYRGYKLCKGRTFSDVEKRTGLHLIR